MEYLPFIAPFALVALILGLFAWTVWGEWAARRNDVKRVPPPAPDNVMVWTSEVYVADPFDPMVKATLTLTPPMGLTEIPALITGPPPTVKGNDGSS